MCHHISNAAYNRVCLISANVRLRTLGDGIPWSVPVPVWRSKAWVCGHSPAEIVGSNPAEAWMSVYYECCVLSGRGLFDGAITRPEESLLTVARRCV